MKNQVQMTPHQLETWVAVLACYEATVVTRACLEIGLSADPFPDLGKVVTRCEVLRRRKAGTEAQSGIATIGDVMLRNIASSLGLEV